MEIFPELELNQVALVRADKSTGHVLDEEFRIALDSGQKVFTIFESFKDAKSFADKVLAFNDGIEIVIYSRGEEVLFYSNV